MDAKLDLVQTWLVKAQRDLASARKLSTGPDPYLDVAIYLCQQAAEKAVGKKNENLGALMSFANALSEKTDTRNWQTLPYSISYARIPLPIGDHEIQLRCYSPRRSKEVQFPIQIRVPDQEPVFYLFHNLESIPLEQ